MTLLFVTGVLSILAQVVVVRELTVASYGIELVAIVALGAWLLGSAGGAAVDSLRAGGQPADASGTCLLLAALGIGVVPAVAFVRAGRALLGAVPGAYLPIGGQLLLVGIAALPLAALAGLSFQWASRLVLARGSTLAAAYAVESTGALAAGAFTTLSLRLGLSTFAVASACAWIGLMTAIAGVVPRAHRRMVVLAAAVLASAAAGALGPRLDARLTRIQHPALLVSRDTPYTRVTIEGDPAQASLFLDDALSFTTGDVDAEVLTALVLLQHAAPSRVVALGGALEGVPAEVLAHRPAALTVAEIDGRMIALALPFVPAGTRSALARRGVRLEIDDPRRLLDSSGDAEAIIVAMPEPVSAAANRFYTREFLDRCRSRLSAGGVVGLRLRVSENTWTPVQRARVASVHAALAASFAHVAVLPTPTLLVMMGSQSPLPPLDVVLSRMAARRLEPRLATPEFVRYVYDNDRRAEAERLLAESAAAPNSDLAPAAFRDAMVSWVGKFWPGVSSWDPASTARGAGPATTAVALLAAASAGWFVRRSAARRRIAVVFVAGLAGMLLETVVLLHYQAKSGVLFADLGVLLTAFMAGLAAGAALVARFDWSRSSETVSSAERVARSAQRSDCRQRHRSIGRVLLVALGGTAAATASAIATGAPAPLAACAVVLAAAGAWVGALFGWASVPVEGSAGPTRGLYAADLLGGCIGAVAGGLVLVPFAGLVPTASVAAALAIVALLAA